MIYGLLSGVFCVENPIFGHFLIKKLHLALESIWWLLMRFSAPKPAKMKLRNKLSELQMNSDLETSNQAGAKNRLSSNAQKLSADKAVEL